MKIPNREIALAAFDRLRREKRKDAALRLAGCMLRGTYISLGIGDTDWEIDTALHKCGGEPKTGYGHMAAHPTNPVECCADANPKTMLPNDT